MLPIGPLMVEHRVIERLMPALRAAAAAGRRNGRLDLRFADAALEFIRTYADRCHHGKEEDILFRALAAKPLEAGHRALMDELVEEHRQGRRKVREIAAALEACRRGDHAGGGAAAGSGLSEPLTLLIDGFEWLASFYPAHIRKEDTGLFLPAMGYFDRAEKDALLAAEREFDRSLLQALYRERVEALAGLAAGPRSPGRAAAPAAQSEATSL